MVNPEHFPMYTTLIPRKSTNAGNKYTLISGVRYIFNNKMLDFLEQDTSIAKNFKYDLDFFDKNFKPFTLDQLPTYRRITIFRSGGIGDLQFSYPALARIKQLNINCKIRYVTNRRNFDFLRAFTGNVIDEVASLPLTKREFQDTDAHIVFEGLIESQKDAETLDAYDLFYRHVFTDNLIDSSLLPQFCVNENIYNVLKLIIPQNLIIMHLRSSSPFRNVRKSICLDVIQSLASCGYHIGLIDANEYSNSIDNFITANFESYKTNIHNLAKHAYSLVHTIEMCRIADYAIGVDSSVINIFASMNKPCIGLYTCFPGKLRLSHFPKAIILQSSYTGCGISPCFHHVDGVPKCVDVRNGKVAGCISGFDAEEIVNRAKAIFHA